MATTIAKKKGTQTPPINADPPVLGPTQYPGPRGRPVRARSQNWDPQAWVQANKRPERSGGKPPQGPEQEPALDTGDNSYAKPNWGSEHGGINSGGMKRFLPRNTWPDQGSFYGGGKPSSGQGGEQVSGGRAIGQKPQFAMEDTSWSGQRDPYAAQGAPQGAPVGGGRPGRQPLRPGMEYRPGGGQRPVGGGMQGAPQDGGGVQYAPQLVTGQALDDYNALQGRADAWRQGGGQGMYTETTYPQNGWQGQSMGSQNPQQMDAWRRRLMQMQQQGPMNNQYYGAF